MTRTGSRPTSATTQIDPYLSDVAQVLFPDVAQVRVTDRRTARRGGQDFVAVPSARRPKLLVPARPRRVAAGAFRNFKTSATRSEKLQLRLLSLAFRLGAHDLLPDHLVMAPAGSVPSGIDAHLRVVLGRPVHVSLYIGPPRAVRKPILQLLDDTGRTFAFAKLGIDRFTRDLVDIEAAAVARVGSAHRDVLRVPDVLHHGTWNGCALLVQSAFTHGTTPPSPTPVLGQAAGEIARTDEVTAGPLGTSSYWARLVERVDTLDPGPAASRLQQALREIGAVHAEAPLEYGCWHGDFAPWNMTATKDQLRVWDWEKFESDVPVGFDLLHWAVQGHVVVGGATPRAAFAETLRDAPALLGPVGNAASAGLVVWLYAVDIATRYLNDRELDAGQTRMTDLATWLPHVLDDAASLGR